MLRESIQKWVGSTITGTVTVRLRRGEDYSISFGEDLAQLTGFERGCAYARRGDEGRYIELNTGGEPLPAANGWSIEHVPFGTPYLMLDEYIARPDVLIVPREVGS